VWGACLHYRDPFGRHELAEEQVERGRGGWVGTRTVGRAEEVAQESFPDDLDQSPDFDPAEPEPIPDGDFDQSRGA
jgi:hypothetical protein